MNASTAPARPTPWTHTVREIVDQVYAGGAGVPPGMLGRLFATVDAMRADGAPRTDVALAEDVVIRLHRLQGMLRTDGARSQAAIAQREGLWRSTLGCLQHARLHDFA